jgi:hypothetical protein
MVTFQVFGTNESDFVEKFHGKVELISNLDERFWYILKSSS